MSAALKQYRTSKFATIVPLVALGALGWLAVAAIAANFFSRTLLRTTVQVPPQETVKLEALAPRRRRIGALRVDTRAPLSRNTWATYEIQIFDGQGSLLASGIKQAWRESGTWQEEGESGTWSKQDLQGRFDVLTRSLDSQQVVVAISVLEHGQVSGAPLTEPVPVEVIVRSGVVDGRYLGAGVVGVLALTVVSLLSVRLSGKKVIDEVVNDSDIGGRGVCGGANRLVQLTLKIAADETTPQAGHGSLEAWVTVKDGQGEIVYEQTLPARMAYRREEGKIEAATGRIMLNLVLEDRDSYGFYVEVMPDGPVDWTYLKVFDGKRTLQAVDVVHL